MNWFDVDKQGLAAILERRGKSFALFELVQNAWDSGARTVAICLTPIAGVAYALLTVEDDSPEGWADLNDAYRMFATSRRASEVEKRGRFNLGEKLVLACCRSAKIETMNGTLLFNETGRHEVRGKRMTGTKFSCEIKMTRDELAMVLQDAARLISPVKVSTLFNGQSIEVPDALAVIETKLPTEFHNGSEFRRTMRTTHVEIYPAGDGQGYIYEMGVPVCEIDLPWILNVMQKVPLNFERDSVTSQFTKALQVAAVNQMANTITEEQATTPWAAEVMGDSRIQVDALKTLVVKKFGERAVVAVPGDPMANANAEAHGSPVIHGGCLSKDAWANVRKHQLLTTTSAAFPSPKPVPVVRKGGEGGKCPMCGK